MNAYRYLYAFMLYLYNNYSPILVEEIEDREVDCV